MAKLPKTWILTVMFLCGFSECQQSVTPSLLVAGYTMLSPPSNLFAPGAVVMMTEDENGGAQLKLLCGPRASLGAHWLPKISATMSSSFKMSRTQKVALEADAVERFRLRTKVEDVETVSVTFSDPKVVELEESDVFELVKYRTEACQQAIDARLQAGYAPTFVMSSYIADVEYVVHFKRERSMSKKAKEERMGQIAAKLGGGHTEVSESTLKAVNLTLAVKTDDFLMNIRPCENRPQRGNDVNRGLGLPYAEALQGSDAPLVPPAGGFVSPIRQ